MNIGLNNNLEPGILFRVLNPWFCKEYDCMFRKN